ncbi:MAG: hypothetical protein EOM20_00285 [Spartobacteria bacterium]|nr:hypothetical protein [Spartobacteria bacterium]
MVVVWRWLACGNTKTLELVALGYFALHACLTLLIGWPFLKTYGMVVNGVVLAGMAFGTLAAKNPFTYQYAKEEWDEIYWDDPEFYAINAIITAVWGGIFSLNALMGVLAVLRPDMRTWFSIVFPTVSMAGGIIFSYQFPLFAVRRGLQQRLDQWEPYKWPPPCFDARPTAEREHDVVVVGSGIGGLSAAALLARRRIMRKRSAGSATR